MSSADFNIDSLLEDLDDIGGADYSTLKYVPHPPYMEKSQSQVRCIHHCRSPYNTR